MPASTSPPRDAPRQATRLARWVSIVVHPFVVALVLTIAVEMRRGWPAATRAALAVALLFVLPLGILMATQVRRGAWGDVDASRARERPALFAVGAVGLLALLGYLYAGDLARDAPLLRGAAGVLALVAACAVVTRWVKVSLHTATAALAATALLARGLPLGWLFVAALAPLGWSRVALGRHRWAEVALGALLGAMAGALIGRLA